MKLKSFIVSMLLLGCAIAILAGGSRYLKQHTLLQKEKKRNEQFAGAGIDSSEGLAEIKKKMNLGFALIVIGGLGFFLYINWSTGERTFNKQLHKQHQS